MHSFRDNQSEIIFGEKQIRVTFAIQKLPIDFRTTKQKPKKIQVCCSSVSETKFKFLEELDVKIYIPEIETSG